MRRRKLTRLFFDRPTLIVARELLGKFLVRAYRGKKITSMITEVEAYDGFRDRGSHARRGKTSRNAPMFGGAGRWYVYFTYGVHWMLNIVTRERGYPAAILIRAGVLTDQNGEPRPGRRAAFLSGPGRLTKFFKIDGKLNGVAADRKSGLWIEDQGWKSKGGYVYPPSRKASEDDFQQKLKIKKGPRVGIDYAGPYWARRHWRFWIKK